VRRPDRAKEIVCERDEKAFIGNMNHHMKSRWSLWIPPVQLVAGVRDVRRAAAEGMSSREAHEVVRATLGRRSLRRDVAPSPGLMDLTGVKLIEADVDWITNHRDEILKQFEEARARASS
jgi:hypothetical protein